MVQSSGGRHTRSRHQPKPPGPRRRWPWVVTGVAAVALVVAAGAWRMATLARDLQGARQDFDRAEAQLKAGQLGPARQSLLVAGTRVTHANGQIHGRPELSLLGLLPVVHQNLDALRKSVDVALELSAGGERLMASARPLEAPGGTFEVPMRSGAVPIAVLQEVGPELDDLATNLPLAADAPQSRFLFGPVHRVVDDVYRQSGKRRAQATTLSRAVSLLTELSGGNGPRRMLIAVANAAEMRGTGGMILSYGEMTSAAGKFTLQHFGGVDDIKLAQPANVSVPADYKQNFDALGPTLNWRSANLGADFTYIGPVMEAMYAKATGKKTDSVVQIDSMGLAALMKGTGPVEVAGLGTVTADNVVRVTLSEAYARISQRTTRQEVLGDVAEAVFRKLVTGDYPSLRPLAVALIDAVAQRRIMLHSGNEDAQRNIFALGAAGELPDIGPDFAALSVQNFGANKIDYYLDTSLKLTGSRRRGALGPLDAEVTLTDTAPAGQVLPQYVFGPGEPGLVPGQYVALATLVLPKGAALVGQGGDITGVATVSTEADRTMIRFEVRLKGGDTRRINLKLQMPPAAGPGYSFVLVPFSRVRPTVFTLDLDRGGTAHVQYNGPLTRPVVLQPR